MTPTAQTTRPAPRWPAYAAASWAFVFALVSFYWALGGTVGAATNAPAITEPVLAREPAAVAVIWITGALKLLLAALALLLLWPRPRRVPTWASNWLPRRLLIGTGWVVTALMAGYEGLASLVQHALMVAGVLDIPAGLGETSARWHLVLWDPWWLLGGVLLGLATWVFQRASRG
jgi:Protein of unknown function (DUF3995)